MTTDVTPVLRSETALHAVLSRTCRYAHRQLRADSARSGRADTRRSGRCIGTQVQNDRVGDANKHRMVSDSPSAAGVTAQRFRELAEDRMRDHGIVGSVAVEPTQTAGLSLVIVEIESGPSILYEVADWVTGVRVLDPDGEDLTISAALDYIILRVGGLKPSAALGLATAPRHRG